MDLTYWIAFVFAALVAFGLSIPLALAGREPTRTQRRRLLLFMLATDFVVLVNWTKIADAPWWVPVADLIFFPVYTMIGIAIGTAPSALVLAIVRRLRR
jgi:hypothetical protein